MKIDHPSGEGPDGRGSRDNGCKKVRELRQGARQEHYQITNGQIEGTKRGRDPNLGGREA